MSHYAFMRLLLAGVLASSLLRGQANVGVITGAVSDSSGAMIPGSVVTVISEEQGIRTAVPAQADGTYVVPNMHPGRYTIAAEKEGFKRYRVSGLRLDVGGRLIHGIVLELGAVTETVNVTGISPLVDTTRGAVGDVVENKRVLELPLNGREVFDLVNLTPGTIRTNQSQRGGEEDISIGGGRTRSAAVYIDGVINSRTGIGATITEFSTPIDAIGEFRVETNAAGADLGRSAAGFINATTKSGTNEFHGTLYEFLRNDALDSRGWGADSKTKLRRNTFGGNLGGPIARNRTFFFYNLEQLVENREALRTRTVPLDTWRTGDFSGLQRSQSTAAGQIGVAVPLFDPLTAPRPGVRGGSLQFANNVIPQSRLDSVALKATAFYPQPNRQPDDPISQAGNWQANAGIETRRTNHVVRIDHALTDKDRLMSRYTIFSPATESDPRAAPDWGFADPNAITRPIRQQNALVAYTRAFSSNLVLEATAGFFRFLQNQKGNGFGEDIPGQLGLTGVPQDVFPRFNIGGNPGIESIGSAGPHNRRFAFTNFEYSGKMTWVTARHTVKFGWDYRRYQGSEEGRQQASGVFGFNGQDTRQVDAAGGPIPNTGAPMADFLLGKIDNLRIQASPSIGRRSYYTGGFVQDDWRATAKLTLNLGLRYDYESPFWEVANRMANWDPTVVNPAAGSNGIPAGQLGAMVFPGREGRGRTLVEPDKNNFGPRFGFAYRPFGTNNTVVRGGFGVMFGGNYDGNVLQTGSQGFIQQVNVTGGAPFTLAQGVPPNLVEIPREEDLNGAFGTIGSRFPLGRVDFVDRFHRTPYALDFNLTVQHQIAEQLFEVRYFSKLGRKINFRDYNINHIRPEDLSRTEIPARLRRPYTQYPGNAELRLNQPNFGISNYHAFSFKAEKRFSRGLGYIVSYTLSKWIDNVPFVGEDGASLGDSDFHQNVFDIRNERSLSNNHVPHRLVVSPIYEVPVGKGKRLLNRGGVLNVLLGGWQISTIATFQSGSPFGITVLNGPRDLLGDNAPYRVLRPNVVGDHRLGDPKGEPAVGRRGIQWFNPDAFAAPPPFTLGNLSRTLTGNLGPGMANFDTAVAKNFSFRERYSLQFRWETFNTFNHPEFLNPADVLFGGGFGTTTAGNSHREMQFALKLYF